MATDIAPVDDVEAVPSSWNEITQEDFQLAVQRRGAGDIQLTVLGAHRWAVEFDLQLAIVQLGVIAGDGERSCREWGNDAATENVACNCAIAQNGSGWADNNRSSY